MDFLAFGRLANTADASARHVAVGIETAHIFLEGQTVAVTVLDAEERESAHGFHVVVRETRHEFVGARPFLLDLLQWFQQMFFPLLGTAHGKLLGHARGKVVDCIAEKFLIELLGAVVQTGGVEIKVRSEDTSVGGKDVAAAGDDYLCLREEFVGTLIPFVCVNDGRVTELHHYARREEQDEDDDDAVAYQDMTAVVLFHYFGIL